MENGKNDSAQKIDNFDGSKKEDLTDLLNEAKSTILNLQDEIKSLKSEIGKLRQQNQEYVVQIESFHSVDTKEKGSLLNQVHTASEMPPPIPLEPVIIVKRNKSKEFTKSDDQSTIAAEDGCNETNNDARKATNCSEHSFTSDDTSQSDNTFVM